MDAQACSKTTLQCVYYPEPLRWD